MGKALTLFQFILSISPILEEKMKKNVRNFFKSNAHPRSVIKKEKKCDAFKKSKCLPLLKMNKYA
jgi:hypothetical protein